MVIFDPEYVKRVKEEFPYIPDNKLSEKLHKALDEGDETYVWRFLGDVRGFPEGPPGGDIDWGFREYSLLQLQFELQIDGRAYWKKQTEDDRFMRTIAFCSYGSCIKRNKTKFLVKCAKRLLNSGKRVFLLDCNVYAPELHKRAECFGKFQYSKLDGFIDVLRLFLLKDGLPDNLQEFTSSFSGGNLNLMLVKASQAEKYIPKAVYLDEGKLFLSKEKNDSMDNVTSLLIALFDRIKDVYGPDYLLIDSPNMVSKISVAVSAAAHRTVWMPTCAVHSEEMGYIMKTLWNKGYSAYLAPDRIENDSEFLAAIVAGSEV